MWISLRKRNSQTPLNNGNQRLGQLRNSLPQIEAMRNKTLLKERITGWSSKRGNSSQHLIQNYPKGINIPTMITNVVLNVLGGYVVRGTDKNSLHL
jgi:hypothetical protein